MGWADGRRFPPQRQALTLVAILFGLTSNEETDGTLLVLIKV